jgi:protein-disulfide isomerase
MVDAQTKKTTRATPIQTLNEPDKGIGLKNAPITLEVFSDYQCPSCRNLYEQTLRPMMGDYVASGKVYLLHRDFPLPGHKYSLDAARWANAAARIGKFQEVDAALYDNQNAWSADGSVEKYVAGALSAADFKRVQRQVDGCLTQTVASAKPASFKAAPQAAHNCAVDTYIEQDKALGKQVPVQATPTYVIYYKGQRMAPTSGFVTWPILKQFFDSLMAQ